MDMGILLDLLFIAGTMLICGLLASFYLEKLSQYGQLVEETNERPGNMIELLWQTSLFPEKGFMSLYNKPLEEHVFKSYLAIFFSLLQFYLISNLLYFIDGPIHWISLLLLSMGVLLLYAVTRRIWAVYRMTKLARQHKDYLKLHHQAEDLTSRLLAFSKNKSAFTDKLNALIKQRNLEDEKMNRIQHHVDALSERIKQFRQHQQYKQHILNHNLDLITSLPEDTEIAIDSNVFMKCDQYIAEALSKRNVLISKRVQQEWDKNKTHTDHEKSFRAREAIRRLINLDHYRFVVSKWNNRFMQENNLQSGVPDDEIIADYLFEYQQGKKLVVISNDNNFIGSAKVHLPILELKNIDLFNSNQGE